MQRCLIPCHVTVCLSSSHPHPRLWQLCSHPPSIHHGSSMSAEARTLPGGSRAHQAGITQPGDCPRFSHRPDPVWDLHKGNYITQAACSCLSCFRAELLQPAPSPAFANTGMPCSTCNRCTKGTLREINRSPSPDQSYHLSRLSGCPTLDQLGACCPVTQRAARPEPQEGHRHQATTESLQSMQHDAQVLQVVMLRKRARVLGEKAPKFLLLTLGEESYRY